MHIEYFFAFPHAAVVTGDVQEAWKQDSRSQEDIGLAVEIDPDGKAATLDGESLTGFGVSKPLRIGAQVRSRWRALVVGACGI